MAALGASATVVEGNPVRDCKIGFTLSLDWVVGLKTGGAYKVLVERGTDMKREFKFPAVADIVPVGDKVSSPDIERCLAPSAFAASCSSMERLPIVADHSSFPSTPASTSTSGSGFDPAAPRPTIAHLAAQHREEFTTTFKPDKATITKGKSDDGHDIVVGQWDYQPEHLTVSVFHEALLCTTADSQAAKKKKSAFALESEWQLVMRYSLDLAAKENGVLLHECGPTEPVSLLFPPSDHESALRHHSTGATAAAAIGQRNKGEEEARPKDHLDPTHGLVIVKLMLAGGPRIIQPSFFTKALSKFSSEKLIVDFFIDMVWIQGLPRDAAAKRFAVVMKRGKKREKILYFPHGEELQLSQRTEDDVDIDEDLKQSQRFPGGDVSIVMFDSPISIARDAQLLETDRLAVAARHPFRTTFSKCCIKVEDAINKKEKLAEIAVYDTNGLGEDQREQWAGLIGVDVNLAALVVGGGRVMMQPFTATNRAKDKSMKFIVSGAREYDEVALAKRQKAEQKLRRDQQTWKNEEELVEKARTIAEEKSADVMSLLQIRFAKKKEQWISDVLSRPDFHSETLEAAKRRLRETSVSPIAPEVQVLMKDAFTVFCSNVQNCEWKSLKQLQRLSENPKNKPEITERVRQEADRLAKVNTKFSEAELHELEKFLQRLVAEDVTFMEVAEPLEAELANGISSALEGVEECFLNLAWVLHDEQTSLAELNTHSEKLKSDAAAEMLERTTRDHTAEDYRLRLKRLEEDGEPRQRQVVAETQISE